MTDKPKTIQEAIAEVRAKSNKQVDEALSDFGVGIGALAGGDPKRSAQYVGRGLRGIGSNINAARQSVQAYFDPEGAKKEFDAPQPGGAEDRLGYSSVVGGEQKTRAGGGTNPVDRTTTTPAPTTAKPPAPAGGVATAPKPETTAKPAPMSFSQAYAKARSMAKPGEDPNKMQFKWTDPKTGKEGTYQSAATKKDYVPMASQTKVDVGAKTPAGPPMSDYQKPQKGPEGPPMPKPVTANVPTPPPRPSEFSVSVNQSAKTDTVPGPSTGDVTPVGGSNIDQNTKQRIKPQPSTKTESTEMTPLIKAFLKLQETKAGNMFEAAKKAKQDYDKDGKIESPKDEVWGSRLRAAKMAGKLKEGEVEEGIMDYIRPSAPKTDSKPESKPVEKKEPGFIQKTVDSMNPFKKAADAIKIPEEVEQVDELKKPTPETAEKVVNRSVDRDEWSPKASNRLYKRFKDRYEQPKPEAKKEVKEEIGFSEAEIAYFNSVMEANPVSPSQAEPTKGTNDTVPQRNLTDEKKHK